MSNIDNTTTLPILSDWLPSKKEIRRLTEEMVHPVLNGEMSSERAIVVIRALKNAIEDAEDIIKETVINDLHKYARNEVVKVLGAEIKLKEMGVKYEYSSCNDGEWNTLDKAIKELTEQRKARENFLKSLVKKEIIVDEATGEVNEVHPPKKISTTSFSILYSKD